MLACHLVDMQLNFFTQNCYFIFFILPKIAQGLNYSGTSQTHGTGQKWRHWRGDRIIGANVLFSVLWNTILGLSKGDRNGEVTLLVRRP